MAKEYGASITVVHAAPTFGEHAQDFVDEGWRATLSGQLQGKLTEMLKDVGAEGDVLVESGSAAEIVAKTATRTQADMVLIGRSTHRGLIGRLKAQAYEIIRHCPCPVLSV
jgi:nucleotide-binding universal stress UspA family protein